MELNTPERPTILTFEKIVDIIIRLSVLLWLIGWCFTILRPFVLVLTWAGVIAIAIYPLYTFFLKIFRQRKTLASVILTAIILGLLLFPSWLVTESLFSEISHLKELNDQGQ